MIPEVLVLEMKLILLHIGRSQLLFHVRRCNARCVENRKPLRPHHRSGSNRHAPVPLNL